MNFSVCHSCQPKLLLISVFFQVLLEQHKAKRLLEESDRYENTPLHVAAKKGFINVVRVSYESVILSIGSWCMCLPVACVFHTNHLSLLRRTLVKESS